ncbi:MAG: OmpA family protein [Deltaproteobacteria bacterium]|nr:OmpA family protein [Deltaproteobacteria bacterium]
MEARLFRSAVDTKGHFTVDATPILPHLAISLGLLLDFGFNEWVAVEQEGKIYDKTKVDTYIGSVLMFNLGLLDMIVVGVQIPLDITSGRAFDADTARTPPEASSAGWSTKGGIGDIALHLKLRWLRADRHMFGVGTVIQYQAPVGKPEFLMGDPTSAISAKMIVDSEPISWYRAALNVGARYAIGASDKNELNGDFCTAASICPANRNLFEYGPMMSFGIGQSFVLWPGVMDFVFEVYGNQMLTNLSSPYFSMEANLGLKVYVERSSYLMAGYAHGLPVAGTDSMYGFQSMEHRMFLGFAFEPSIGDRDSDGIKDDLDKCPDDPEDMDGFEDSDGCPDPDNDRDGIPDVNDDCPLVPEDRDGDRDTDGCPDENPNDRDGDGILDNVDQCPDDPEDLDGFQDKDGCPDEDNDNDRILDVNDLCPNEPEDMDGFEDQNGCPDPDNDSDGIPDVNDQCPNEPETYNGKDDTDGCPDQGDVVLTRDSIQILKKVYFEYDSAVIKEMSYGILDAVAATIKGNPQIDLIEVQGHADERGAEDYNLKLTADRAASVVSYLAKKGVNPKKLRSAGYGALCPIAQGHNEAAWEQNRRVEFKVLSIDGNPTGVETACEAAKKKGIVAK